MEEQKRFHDIVLILLFFILLFSIGTYLQYAIAKTESIKYNDIGLELHEASGINLPGFGYFVQTNGRNFEEINTTDYHEACHELIRKDYSHLCEEYYQD